MNRAKKSEIVETGILAFVFGCAFWMSAEVTGFIFGMVEGLLDMM